MSVGQYHFEDDGFRVNDEVEHDVVSVLAKYAPTPEITFTAEARGRETNQGNRFLRPIEDPFVRLEEGFDPSLFRLGVYMKATSESGSPGRWHRVTGRRASRALPTSIRRLEGR